MEHFTPAKGNDQRRLLKRLEQYDYFKKAEVMLAKFVGPFKMLSIDKKTAAKEESLRKMLCKNTKTGNGIQASCVKNLLEATLAAERSKAAEVFNCPVNDCGLVYPLIHNEEVFGYLIGCGLPEKPEPAKLELFGYFTEAVLGSVKKDMELETLYKTMQPRTIALSTVHTVHRLISSTLYLDELLRRIARLSMQIIKSNRCSIKLVDSRRKTLLPKATVDLRSKETKLKKVKIGRFAPGKAVKYGKSIKGKRYLATPLIDEDVIGVITLYDKVDKKSFTSFDAEIMRTLAEQAAIAIKNAQLYREQEKLTMGSIKALAEIIESRSAGICMPKPSFLRIVRLIGQEFGMRENELKTLEYATLLHDTGELLVPEKVIRKKGKLTAREFQLIKEHPLRGAKLIKSLKSLKSITPIIMHHHENYDGTGYPKGLRGAEIPLGARIMAVVGAFEAMVTKRPYRMSISVRKAIEEIKKNSGRQFDAKVVERFLKIVKRKDVINLLKKEI